MRRGAGTRSGESWTRTAPLMRILDESQAPFTVGLLLHLDRLVYHTTVLLTHTYPGGRRPSLAAMRE